MTTDYLRELIIEYHKLREGLYSLREFNVSMDIDYVDMSMVNGEEPVSLLELLKSDTETS